jgi:hypothetical protein
MAVQGPTLDTKVDAKVLCAFKAVDWQPSFEHGIQTLGQFLERGHGMVAHISQ